MSELQCEFCLEYTDECVCKAGKKCRALEASLKEEHENFLAVHRNNMELSARNVDLIKENSQFREVAREAVKALEMALDEYEIDQKSPEFCKREYEEAISKLTRFFCETD